MFDTYVIKSNIREWLNDNLYYSTKDIEMNKQGYTHEKNSTCNYNNVLNKHNINEIKNGEYIACPENCDILKSDEKSLFISQLNHYKKRKFFL